MNLLFGIFFVTRFVYLYNCPVERKEPTNSLLIDQSLLLISLHWVGLELDDLVWSHNFLAGTLLRMFGNCIKKPPSSYFTFYSPSDLLQIGTN